MTALATLPALPPTLIGDKYRLDAELGEGGMGVVWRAFNVQLEMPVAIKLLQPGLSAEFAERLRTEARAAAQLMHPGIVRVFDVGESEAGEPFIVMELLSGESLADVMDAGPLSATRAVQLLLPIVDALALAHSRGVVHRDLKPDNIFVTAEGGVTQPKLVDFGIAKLSEQARGGSSKLTQAGTLLGSPEYMSPEQARGLPDVDHRSDIWSLCVVLYEALSGQVPFEAPNCPALLRSIIEDTPVNLLEMGVDAKLAALVQRGLDKEPARRYSSMLELGQALAAWLVEQGVQEDVTGAFLAAKWSTRSSTRPSWSKLSGVRPRASRIEGGTLVSVINPELGPSRPRQLERRRVWRWLPKTAAAMLALAAAALGGVVVASPAVEPASVPTTTPAVAMADTAVQAPVPMTVEVPQLASEKPASPRLARAVKPTSAPVVATVAPAQSPSDPKQDLMDPYK